MDRAALKERITQISGANVISMAGLSGGCVANVMRAELDDGRCLVIKHSNAPGAGLLIEAEMLRYFAGHAPNACPDVLDVDDTCLIMTFISNDNRMTQGVQIDLAEKLAAQHSVTADTFGLGFNTLIGGLHQPNPETKSWVTFFGEHRLRHMAHAAMREGQLPGTIATRIDRLIDELANLIPDQPTPSLLHGDLWGGNILCLDGKLAGLIDPAIYYGDHEMELAFGTLFGDLTADFFDRYSEIKPIEPGFFEERRDLYNLYPLLVHVRLFGVSYVRSVDHILAKFGH